MKQLDPKAVWLFFLSSVLPSLIPILLLSIYGGVILSLFNSPLNNDNEFSFKLLSSFFSWLWIIFPVSIALSFVWAKLTYHFYRYELTDAGFRKESGVIYKKYVTIPYDRIQNVDIYRGILARILALSDLHIQTAGMSSMMGVGISVEGQLPALSKEDAEQLRDELIQRARQAKNQGL